MTDVGKCCSTHADGAVTGSQPPLLADSGHASGCCAARSEPAGSGCADGQARLTLVRSGCGGQQGVARASPCAAAQSESEPVASGGDAKESHDRHACCGSTVDADRSELATGTAANATEAPQTRLRIQQMDCPTEEALLRKSLARLSGIQRLEFHLMQRQLWVWHQADTRDALLAAIRALGFEPELLSADQPAAASAVRPASNGRHRGRLALAGVLALGSELSGWWAWNDGLAAGLALAAITLAGLDTYRKGLLALRHRDLNINALMSIAVTGALLLGEWPEAAMVMVLFAIAEAIEARSLDRARQAIAGLMALAPDSATLWREDRWQSLPLAQIEPGSRVRVQPGERIGLDGEILDGHSSFNQAPITGESLPVDKGPGEPVFAGTINLSGSVEYRVTAPVTASRLARIIETVEAAQASKAPTQRFVDRFARLYTPAVVVLALLVAIVPPLWTGAGWQDWLYQALVLLIIACPCALVIATPVTVVSGLAAAARHGILIKGGVYLEQGWRLRWLALDKTGTLTEGQPEVTDIEPLAELSLDQCLALALSLASRSDHPVSQALLRIPSESSVARSEVQAFHALPGRGVSGQIAGQDYALANLRLAQEWGLELRDPRLQALQQQAKTLVLLLNRQQVLAVFAVADRLKAHSREALAELQQLGIRTLMLTGDNAATAEAIGQQAGLSQIRANLLPDDKLQAVIALREQGPVGMVGDGINDTPALAQADLGFAMGSLGSDSAIETADVALMDDDLRKIPAFIRLSRQTHRILRQNILLALGIKWLVLVLSLAGLGSLWLAVVADMGTSLLVVANGLRLLRTLR